jgi:hypothetical protein
LFCSWSVVANITTNVVNKTTDIFSRYAPRMAQDQTFDLDGPVSNHESRFPGQIGLISFIIFSPAKAQERKDCSVKNPIIVLLFEYSSIKKILGKENSSLKISLGAFCALA